MRTKIGIEAWLGQNVNWGRGLGLLLVAMGILVAGPAAADWYPLGSGMSGGTYPMVWALTDYDGELIAGGWFPTAGGVTCNYIARWDGSTWQTLGSGMDDYVYALAEYNGELIAGGGFTTAGGVVCNHIASWNGSDWQPLGTGMDSNVEALTVYNGDLIAAGGFYSAGGVPCLKIARWDGTTWQPLGTGLSSRAGTLTVYNDLLIAGGNFQTAGGVECKYIARWDGSTWQPLGEGMSGSVRGLTVYNEKLIAGGNFYSAGGVTCRNIASWDGNIWQPLGTGMGGPQPWMYALTLYDSDLIAGGNFTTAGDVTCSRIARWRDATVAGSSLTCVPATGTVPFTSQITVVLNNASDYPRRAAGRIDTTLANGILLSNWRYGYTDLAPGDFYVSSWNQVIPATNAVIGKNVAHLVVEDVTLSPWNQPPYPPSGDTGTDSCTVTGIAP